MRQACSHYMASKCMYMKWQKGGREVEAVTEHALCLLNCEPFGSYLLTLLSTMHLDGSKSSTSPSPPPTPRISFPRSLVNSSYLKDNGLIILFEVEGKDVCVHECGTTLAEDINCFLQELDLNPWHVVLLHLFHFLLDLGIEFVLKAQALHMVHVTIAVEEVPLQGCSGSLR